MTFSVLLKILNFIYRLLTNFLNIEILYPMIFNLSVRFFTVTVTILNYIYLFEIIKPNILGLFLYLQRNFVLIKSYLKILRQSWGSFVEHQATLKKAFTWEKVQEVKAVHLCSLMNLKYSKYDKKNKWWNWCAFNIYMYSIYFSHDKSYFFPLPVMLPDTCRYNWLKNFPYMPYN